MSYVKGDRGGNMKRTDFSHFGKSFQEALCLLMLEDRPFADQILEVFDITFFRARIPSTFCIEDNSIQIEVWRSPY